MVEILITNRDGNELEIFIEPVAERYLLNPATSAILKFEQFENYPIEIEYRESSQISVWTHADTEFCVDGKPIKPI